MSRDQLCELLRACWIDQASHGRHAIGRNAHSPCVFQNDRFIRGDINAVHFIARDVAVEPLDLGTESF